MDSFRVAQTDMLYVGDNVLTINEAIWLSNPVFAPLVVTFRLKLTRIGQLVQIVVRNDEGITIDKNDSKLLLILKALRMGRAIRTYSAVSGNDSLAKSVTFTESSLMEMKELFFIGVMENCRDIAVANATALLDYEITADDISDFSDEITAFIGWKADPRTATIQRKSANDELDRLVQETVDFLANQIDVAMYLFQESHPVFYADWFNGRVIVDPHTSTMALRGHVMDSETGLPIEGANIFIPDNGDNRTTGPSGIFEVINLTEGIHDINLTHPAYQPLVFVVTIVSGQTTDVDIAMTHL